MFLLLFLILSTCENSDPECLCRVSTRRMPTTPLKIDILGMLYFVRIFHQSFRRRNSKAIIANHVLLHNPFWFHKLRCFKINNSSRICIHLNYFWAKYSCQSEVRVLATNLFAMMFCLFILFLYHVVLRNVCIAKHTCIIYVYTYYNRVQSFKHGLSKSY